MEREADTDVEAIREKLQRHLTTLRERYHVESLGLFGSYVHQQQNAGSDVDVLVTFSEPPSLLEFIALENYLSDLLGVRVDLVMRDALKPHLRRRILDEVVSI
ncbi:MAG: nucleotidyltransferase family protein [Anaerolineae bacterium]